MLLYVDMRGRGSNRLSLSSYAQLGLLGLEYQCICSISNSEMWATYHQRNKSDNCPAELIFDDLLDKTREFGQRWVDLLRRSCCFAKSAIDPRSAIDEKIFKKLLLRTWRISATYAILYLSGRAEKGERNDKAGDSEASGATGQGSPNPHLPGAKGKNRPTGQVEEDG